MRKRRDRLISVFITSALLLVTGCATQQAGDVPTSLTYEPPEAPAVFNFDIPPAKPSEHIVYHASMTKVTDISPNTNPGRSSPLPNQLIIKPGRYTFAGRKYDLNREGLYRFIHMWGAVEQRFVFNGNVEALISAISWATVHGLGDINFHELDYKRELQSRKLSLTCWPVSNLSRILLQEKGLKARIVSLFTQQDPNQFDDGHALLEVFHPDLRKWIAYDVNNNVIPTDAGKRLSALEVYDRVKNGLNIDFELLSADSLSNPADLKYSGTFDGTFYYDRLASGPHALRSFYDRVFQAIAIFDGQADSYPILDEQISDDFRAYLDNLDKRYTWLGRVKFVKRTYSRR